MITYRVGNDLDLDRVLELYRASTYPKLGFTKHSSAWILRANEELR
ncbi:MAG: hypothetical protein L0Z51_09030 [Candidatus Latescibacteria bacterium]|nr:hypothetical protein [Candidatus Latescibacterota bacterium]